MMNILPQKKSSSGYIKPKTSWNEEYFSSVIKKSTFFVILFLFEIFLQYFEFFFQMDPVLLEIQIFFFIISVYIQNGQFLMIRMEIQ